MFFNLCNRRTKNSKNKGVPFLVLNLFMLFALPDVANAATPYYWHSYFFERVAESPAALCSSVQAYGFVLTSSGREGRCTSSKGTQLWNGYIHRVGDSCPPGKSYDPTAGSCDVLSTNMGQPCTDQTGAIMGNPMIAQENGSCVPYNKSPQNNGNPQDQVCSIAGNPINFAVGNKIQTELDYQGAGAAPLAFSRTYNSIDGIWRHSFSTNLRIGSELIILTASDGRESYFSLSNGMATSTSNDLGALTKEGGLWSYTAANNQRFDFDAAGRLKKVSYPSGLTQQLTAVYNSNSSSYKFSVIDSFGQSLTFYEDASRQPLSLTASGINIVYTYDASNRLIKVARTISGQTRNRTFTYNGISKLLTGITDERGVLFASWTYDSLGRAITSSHVNGADKVSISYKADGSTAVTNPLNKQTTYQFQFIQGAKFIVSIKGEPSANCPNSNSNFTYDERGLLKTKIDNKGHLTTFDYNERGLEVSRTEATGTPQARTITTDWHPEFFLPVTVTEPNRITQYTYDAQGRQLSQTVTQR